MDHESDVTMEQFIFLSCVSMSVEMDIKHHPWCLKKKKKRTNSYTLIGYTWRNDVKIVKTLQLNHSLAADSTRVLNIILNTIWCHCYGL